MTNIWHQPNNITGERLIFIVCIVKSKIMNRVSFSILCSLFFFFFFFLFYAKIAKTETKIIKNKKKTVLLLIFGACIFHICCVFPFLHLCCSIILSYLAGGHLVVGVSVRVWGCKPSMNTFTLDLCNI